MPILDAEYRNLAGTVGPSVEIPGAQGAHKLHEVGKIPLVSAAKGKAILVR